MESSDERALELLQELGSRPAAPFFEHGPSSYIWELLAHLEVEASHDAYGNILAHYEHSTPSSQPPIALVAHMDHPGFEVIKVSAGRVVARALGGVPAASLEKPTPVLVLPPDGRRLQARTAPYVETPPGSPEGEPDRLVELHLDADVELIPPLPVVFDLPDFALDGDTIRMRALDDLAGCASILAALERITTAGASVDLYAVFTRAEETGLLGARLLAEAGTLPRDTLMVSVEASAVIPGVAQGEGPVIRTGDASYTFDADAEQVLITARQRLKERDPDFKTQRHLMSGGTCEATAFAVFGYRTTGVAFPLGNYHNATTRIADPDGGVDAEYIHLSDFLAGIELLEEAAKSVAQRRDSPTRKRLRNVPDDIKKRLEESAGLTT